MKLTLLNFCPKASERLWAGSVDWIVMSRRVDVSLVKRRGTQELIRERERTMRRTDSRQAAS